jgi:hypothetical protein
MPSLITWNMQCARMPDGTADVDRIVEHVLGCDAAFDLLLLQEVGCGLPARDGSPGGDQFAGLARRLAHLHGARAYALDARNADGSPRRLGCMTFARHPIVHVRRHALPWPPDPEVPTMPRAVLDTVVAMPDGPLRVLNTHLEYFSPRQRMAQVERLRELQAEALARARPGRRRPAARVARRSRRCPIPPPPSSRATSTCCPDRAAMRACWRRTRMAFRSGWTPGNRRVRANLMRRRSACTTRSIMPTSAPRWRPGARGAGGHDSDRLGSPAAAAGVRMNPRLVHPDPAGRTIARR